MTAAVSERHAVPAVVLPLLLLLPLLAGGTLAAGDVGFLEDFALAADRAGALEQLIPGTEDYYFFHSLHFQNTGKLDEVEKVLPTWIERHGRTARVVEIENRQALLRYPDDPKRSLDLLRKRLGLEFNHQREARGEDLKLPAGLDPALLRREALAARALELHRGTTDGFEDRALEWAVGLDLGPERRRHLLGRLARPDVPDLPRLVIDDLKEKKSGGFGSLGIHGRLLLPQLEECLRLKPDLLNETKLVNTYLPRLWPDADGDWRNDARARQAYLERLWAFVSRLEASHNSLKAHVLHHRLAHDRALGVHDKERFLTYLKLPRNAPYMRRSYLEAPESRRGAADLAANFQAATLLPPAGNDEPLVRAYLEHFFLSEDDYKPYEAYVSDAYLKRLFAETKIVNGLGDAEAWYSMLSPAEVQALRERVDLDFAATNKTAFGAEEQVALDLDVKGVKSLIVKVFELNAPGYYERHLREIDTAIDLDGLVASEESTHEYTEPDLRRVRRHFEFPPVTRRGAYAIEFIGGGRSSRALILKGRLRYLVRTSTAGHVFTVLDEANRALPDAAVRVGGHRYEADREGLITVPYTAKPGSEPLVLIHGDFASLDRFRHEAESYALAAGFHVEREALLTRARATVLVRPSLALNGVPVTLSVLEDPTLVITSTDLEGVRTTKEVKGFAFHEDRESAYEFQVPANLARIEFTLGAKVQNLSQGKKVELEASRSFELNQIDLTDKIEDLHLGRAEGEYALDLLGRTGEARPGRPVQLTLKHRDFRDALEVTLQSDASGRLRLGTLDGIDWVQAAGPEGNARSWRLDGDRAAYPGSLHGRAGAPLRVPFFASRGPGSGGGVAGKPSRADAALLELRGKAYVQDRFDALTLEDGYLVLQGLSAGDYELHLKPSATVIAVRLAAGVEDRGHVLSGYRQLELGSQAPLQVASVAATADAVTIRLRGATKFTRVHVAASRYPPDYPMHQGLDLDLRPALDAITTPSPESRYVVGRDIGDEYRYILERQRARKFPGNMLERPSLLLSPWAVRSTETDVQDAKAGTATGEETPGVVQFYGRDARRKEGGFEGTDQRAWADYNFLAEPALLLANLRPDETGAISIPRGDLGGRHHLQVVAVGPGETVSREVSLPEAPARFKDLRLAEGFDPGRHFLERREVTIALEQAPFAIADLTTSEFELYDTIGKVHNLYVTLTGDANLVEFAFAARWPELKPEEKREKYSKYACHELNFFLSRKDPAFFAEVVRPHLRNKLHKTFLDRWLLDEDLSEFLRPWAFDRLNIVERILLGRRLPGEDARVARHVRDLLDLIPPDAGRAERLFKTALRGRALEAADELGVEKARQEAERLKELKEVVRAEEAEEEKLEAGGARGAEARKALSRRGRGARAAPPAPAAAALAAPADKAPETLALGEEEAAAAEPDQKAFYFRDVARRGAVRQLYRKLDTTQEWAENNYHRLPIEAQDASLVTTNAFWEDFARHDGRTPFYSRHLAEASRSFAEMMLALAVLDLPFAAGEHSTSADGLRLTLRPASPLIIFHQEIKEAAGAEEKTPILVTQHYYRQGDRYLQAGAEKLDKFVTDEFLVHAVYGCHVVITNPTSSPQRLDVLLQVPRGSIPVLGGQATRSLHVDLEPYHTWTADHHFYFPRSGTYPHFPVHVSRAEKLVAFAPPASLKVVDTPGAIDRASWEHVSQRGSTDDVLAYIRERNLGGVVLGKIAWRMRERPVFDAVLGILLERHVYDHVLWSYGIFHGLPEPIREYLRHADDFVSQCGAAIESPLLVLDPVERRSYQHLEYWPLVNARAHRLGKERQILNDRFHEQYMALLNVLAYRPALDDDDLLGAAAYLLLQDRVEEAQDFFARLRSERLASRLQYDYLDTYLAFYREDLRRARQTAATYASYPVDRWRNRFAAALSQLDEIEGKGTEVVDPEERTQVVTRLAATEPSFDFEVVGGEVKLAYQGLEECRVNYYLTDIELLFSRSPFVADYSGQFSHVRPNATAVVKLDPAKSAQAFAIPEKLAGRNVLVEVVAAGERKARPYFSGALATQVIENYAQARVTNAATGKALAGVYVKVYARMGDGSVRFYKDGYTDLRGRFEYGSLSTNELENVQRFAVLFLSGDHGAVVREAPPPKL